jgi:hypothetical protein
VYNHLPQIDPTRSLDGRHRRSPRDEEEALRHMHRAHVAAERKRAKERPSPSRFPERLVSGPAAAVLALMGMRR